ncbi:hypothetical protein Y032_0383g384 [Ancylostoma ceylanicum]|uniref:Uncharacterized protein n=1 Tax=Ancylostoma ceylanicum TaxID=53326 RepID=A0A016RTP2_9BILA|nr:hypothetical protein Y032_0383g384 [Ancylostoma ceylanicum]
MMRQNGAVSSHPSASTRPHSHSNLHGKYGETARELMERRNRVAEQYVEFEEAYHGLRGHERKRGLS